MRAAVAAVATRAHRSLPVSVVRRLVRSLAPAVLLVFLVLLAAPGPARAANDHIECSRVTMETRDDGYYLAADCDIELKPRIAEALDRGLTLYFVVDVNFTRSRWYWFDEHPVKDALATRLSYYALTRQYRVATGNLQVGFATLAEALAVIGHVRDWKVAERGALKPGELYAVEARMRLDTTQLPKPFQINALTTRDWVLDSDWRRFAFEVPR